jgi:hypothetical protein
VVNLLSLMFTFKSKYESLLSVSAQSVPIGMPIVCLKILFPT